MTGFGVLGSLVDLPAKLRYDFTRVAEERLGSDEAVEQGVEADEPERRGESYDGVESDNTEHSAGAASVGIRDEGRAR